jgi:hypothetical protein
MLENFHKKQITPIGVTNWRDTNIRFGIKATDRLAHIYVIGKTGTGKSTMLANMAIADIEQGNGLCVIDPHGDIATQILNYIPKERIQDVIYFNATDAEYAVGFNPLADVDPRTHTLVTANLISTFKKIWIDSWGPRLEHILRFSILTLLWYPGATLLDIPMLLTNAFFRRKVLQHVSESSILNFWHHEFDTYTPQLKSEAIAPILNKVGILLAAAPLRNILGQQKTTLNLQDVLDQKKILICNLSKGQIGEDAATILGSIIVTALQSAALSRAANDSEQRTPFYLYVDEMHSFVTLSFADILAEARKYGLALFLSHQYLEQVHEKIRAAIFGNVGTLVSFRIGAVDAAEIAKEFQGIFSEDDLVNLPKYSMYLKLMIDGTTSKPFSATTIPLKPYAVSFAKDVIAYSREHFATKATVIVAALEKRSQHTFKQQKSLFE